MDDLTTEDTDPGHQPDLPDGASPAPSIPPADPRPVFPPRSDSVVPSTDSTRSPSGARWEPLPGSAGAERYAATPAPTAQWPRPPVSDAPPRPADERPPSLLAAPTGPPPPPGEVAPAPEPRSPRRLLKAIGVAVVALSLVSGGFALGTVLSDQTDSANPTGTLRPLSERPAAESGTNPQVSPSPPVLPEDVPGPLADEEAEEPVAAVAAALSPSVVQILTNFGQGSGIVWDSANGYIVTNDHVVGGEAAVSVRFADGSQADGEVLGGSSATDVAVVRVDPALVPLDEAVFAPTSSVEVGQLAVAIGSPFGLDQSVTAGIVSAIRINEFGGSDPGNPVPVEMVQTDAPINPGNSGGALADRQGRVIGMNTSIRTDGISETNVGVGFAVPSDTIVLIAQRIVNGESLELGYLGVTGSLDSGIDGVLITEVVEGSPAESSGLDVGDVIVALDGDSVGEIAELSAAIKLYRPGDLVELEIDRGGDRFVAEVNLGSLSEN